MSLFPYGSGYFGGGRQHSCPAASGERMLDWMCDRMMSRMFNDMGVGGSLCRPSNWTMTPYWLQQAPANQCSIGNAVGQMVNTDEKFGIAIDVSQFRPDELSVDVREHELILEGHHQERNDEHGTIERHFVRKYTIPEEVHLESLESNLDDHGILSVSAKKMVAGKVPARKIPIQTAPKSDHASVEHQQK